MADWLKFDPLKNLDIAKGFSLDKEIGEVKGSLSLGWRIGTAINRAIARRRAQSQAEDDAMRERERLDEALRNPPPIHGSARWAKAGELESTGLLRDRSAFDSPSSLLLGVFPDPDLGGAIGGQLHWDGEGHLITVAPTRSGKSTTAIVPNLLRYRGSCVVLDPKGELYRATGAWRRNVGPVYRIAPLVADTDGFNPFGMIETFADARALASLLMPVDTKAQDFFRKDAVAFLTAAIMFIREHAPPEHRTLKELRNLTGGKVERLHDFVRTLAASGVDAYANPAETFLTKRRESIGTLRDTFNSELSIWDDPGVAQAASGSLDFRSLKDAPATVYITVPFDKLDAYAPFLKVALSSALDGMVRNERLPDIPVLFVLDEFLSLGPFPQFRDAIRTHAGAGVRLWFFLQDVATLQEHYPQSWRTFLNAAVKQFFGTNDAYTGELISTYLLGPTTYSFLTGGVTIGSAQPTGPDIFGHGGNTSQSVNVGVGYAQRPLLTPTEVIGLLSTTRADEPRKAILSVSSHPHPIAGLLVPYFTLPIFQERVAPPDGA